MESLGFQDYLELAGMIAAILGAAFGLGFLLSKHKTSVDKNDEQIAYKVRQIEIKQSEQEQKIIDVERTLRAEFMSLVNNIYTRMNEINDNIVNIRK